MGMSARVLGQAVQLTAQEMNALLKEEGFLDGNPGAYAVTKKGEKYAHEQDHHRGTGGYSWYNRDWTTRTWDEAIARQLDVTDEKKQQIRRQIAEARRAARMPVAEKSIVPQLDQGSPGAEWDARPLLVIGGVVAVGFGIYKSVQHIMRLRNEQLPSRPGTKPAEPSRSEAVENEPGIPGPRA